MFSAQTPRIVSDDGARGYFIHTKEEEEGDNKIHFR